MKNRRYKQRRKCSTIKPLAYMTLELLGIVEGLLIGYSIFGNNIIYGYVSIIVAISLFTYSIFGTITVLNRKCDKSVQ